MYLISICLFIFCISTIPVNAQIPDNPVFTSHADVGDIQEKGDLEYNSSKQTFTITGGGANIWAEEDAFHFAWKKMSGNFILRSRVKFLGEGEVAHRKTGWMVRASQDADSRYVDAVVHGDGLTSMQFRKNKDGTTKEITLDIENPAVIQLEKQGDKYIMGAAKCGGPMIYSDTLELSLSGELYAGVVMCSHKKGITEKARYSNVRITVPENETSDVNSRLEILDVETHERKVIYTTQNLIEAPNWSRDGEHLIYNSDGKLYKIATEGENPEQINTDFAESLNNDHGLSFDGKKLAISHHDEEKGGSRIYVLPSSGGTPEPITPKVPSYWHGWSPDGKYLVYTARRNNAYNIYKIPASGDGEEIQITDHSMLDDGPEYSPNGTYIYMCSSRTGTMQTWRMKPDGSDLEQLTYDKYNDWFPHVAPANNKLVFVSYPPEIGAEDHPRHKQVMLRSLHPSARKKPETLCHVYGGQGTINVPSWSPDGTKVAFVSYTFPGGDDYD